VAEARSSLDQGVVQLHTRYPTAQTSNSPLTRSTRTTTRNTKHQTPKVAEARSSLDQGVALLPEVPEGEPSRAALLGEVLQPLFFAPKLTDLYRRTRILT